jgi:TRAP-type C4-dicarboxylate transport system permease small subunit
MQIFSAIHRVLKKIDTVFDKIQKVICAAALLNMVVVGSIQVFGRFIFHVAPSWTEEVMRFSMIYLGFFAVNLTARRDGHVAMDVLQERLKNNTMRMYFYIGTRMVMVMFSLMCIPWGFELVSKTQRSMASSVPISWSYIYLALPIGCIMLVVAILAGLPEFAGMVGRGEK